MHTNDQHPCPHLLQAYEELGGTWKRGAAAGGAPAAAAADGPPADIAAALAAEVAELRDTDKQALYYHPIGLHSVVYLELRDGEGPSPTQLVQHVCAAADAARTCRTRFCNRFYPIDRTCFASMEKIGEAAAAVVGEHFPADAAEGVEVRQVLRGGRGQPSAAAVPITTHSALCPQSQPPRPPPLGSLRCSTTHAPHPAWTAWRSSTPLPTWCR